jgi:hypothetical protein
MKNSTINLLVPPWLVMKSSTIITNHQEQPLILFRTSSFRIFFFTCITSNMFCTCNTIATRNTNYTNISHLQHEYQVELYLIMNSINWLSKLVCGSCFVEHLFSRKPTTSYNQIYIFEYNNYNPHNAKFHEIMVFYIL